MIPVVQRQVFAMAGRSMALVLVQRVLICMAFVSRRATWRMVRGTCRLSMKTPLNCCLLHSVSASPSPLARHCQPCKPETPDKRPIRGVAEPAQNRDTNHRLEYALAMLGLAATTSTLRFLPFVQPLPSSPSYDQHPSAPIGATGVINLNVLPRLLS